MSFPYSFSAPRVTSPEITLEPGQVLMPAAGWYWYKGGLHTTIQRYDPIAGIWRFGGDDSAAMRLCYFDGNAARIANTSGCAVGAVVTTASTGYTTAPTVTASAGSSTWQAIVGGCLSTAAVIGSAGSGYTYPPILWIEQPPNPGCQATGYTTIANGTISAVTIQDQGAGYIYPPNVAVVNDWRDTTGSGGAVSLAVIGSGAITAVLCTNHGNPITSGTVPTLTFGSGSAAATVVMDWGVQSASVTTAGSGYTNGVGALTASAAGGYVTTAPTYLGGAASLGMSRYRPAIIDVTTNSNGGLSAIGAIIDAGHYQSVPTPVITSAQPSTTTGVLSIVMGGVNSTIFLMPAQQ